MAIDWKNHPRPIIALAPMAGYTDTAYRQLIKGIEPRVLCFTEFTSADGIIYESKNTLSQLDFNPEEEKPLVAQIFGKKLEHFTKAATILEKMGVDAIDINMGCPARKVISSDHGSALLKDPSKAAAIVAATVAGTSLPVSVKTRIGTDALDLPWFIQFCKDMESAGASLLSIHGRTAKQMYTGLADWGPIYEVKKNVGIPVIGNGDIRSAKDAREKLGNLDGIMVGRGTMGNPWLMKEIAAEFFGEQYTPPKTYSEKLPTILRHCELMVESKGEVRGIKEMRKHFVGFMKGFRNARAYRNQVVNIETLEQAFTVLQEIEKMIGDEPSNQTEFFDKQ
ncbi:MAG: tRNA-dihydrouridine synthase B [Oceanicoccus sp.]|jgi:tRNA-dihydrouridine synthase B